MLGDMWGALLALRTLRVRFVPGGDSVQPTASFKWSPASDVREPTEAQAGNFQDDFLNGDGSHGHVRKEGVGPTPLTSPQSSLGRPPHTALPLPGQSAMQAEGQSCLNGPPEEEIEMTLALPAVEFGALPDALRGVALPVIICLFSQGVNEQQTIANAQGNTELQAKCQSTRHDLLFTRTHAGIFSLPSRPIQERINHHSFHLLSEYVHAHASERLPAAAHPSWLGEKVFWREFEPMPLGCFACIDALP